MHADHAITLDDPIDAEREKVQELPLENSRKEQSQGLAIQSLRQAGNKTTCFHITVGARKFLRVDDVYTSSEAGKV